MINRGAPMLLQCLDAIFTPKPKPNSGTDSCCVKCGIRHSLKVMASSFIFHSFTP